MTVTKLTRNEACKIVEIWKAFDTKRENGKWKME